MALNNQGLTTMRDGNAAPGQQDTIGALLNGRDAIDVNGVQIDLGETTPPMLFSQSLLPPYGQTCINPIWSAATNKIEP